MVNVLVHLLVLETNDEQAAPGENGIAPAVFGALLLVNRSVDLHHNTSPRAHEVHDEPFDCVLAPEVKTTSVVSHAFPHSQRRGRHLLSGAKPWLYG